ncbi:hypothetical protein [Metabacillus sp. RGM 3146]|uniref:hypothetical protein n=1 Tax=Metabacillus sp. RGM 3146 TaxID=3401092 RepID=UPI003B9A88DC
MRDVEMIDLNDEEQLIIAADNAGSIGIKELDAVKADYKILAASTLRVAMMECLSTGAFPLSIVIHNFCGGNAWTELLKGCHSALEEGGWNVPITGSSETNFSMLQSALSVTVIGKLNKKDSKINRTPDDALAAVIGKPLLGSEVLEQKDLMAPLSLFQELLTHPDVYEILPAGSKGILYEYRQLTGWNGNVSCKLDLNKPAGPSACFLITFHPSKEEEIKRTAGSHFWPIERVMPS